ncbi:mitochondrial import receptor subunit TOM20 homolog [Ctenocephalides felis]|uniref:mitochondrial import receptor subunit TOM20 homolog n=1 Tax=Ctenocephalides felis TaxID=7515 RepID=UPI000E6E2817|nr:mitochondrial import receptor subunit TOM20 homolog [Ctenocephalides felis]
MMGILTRLTMGMLAGMMVGSVILGYCLYFDHQRTKDPNYKRRLREKRTKKDEDSDSPYPNREDLDACREYLQNEVNLGEEGLGRGDVARGITHVANAILYSGYPRKLLQILQQTLPPPIFFLLIQELHVRSKMIPGNFYWLDDYPLD